MSPPTLLVLYPDLTRPASSLLIQPSPPGVTPTTMLGHSHALDGQHQHFYQTQQQTPPPHHHHQQQHQQQQQHGRNSQFSDHAPSRHQRLAYLQNSPSSFTATPLTPNLSQSSYLFPPSSTTPPPSLEASPAFSAINSPAHNDFNDLTLFEPADFSMQENNAGFGGLQYDLPIKVYPSTTTPPFDNVDLYNDSTLLPSGLPFESDYLHPAKFAQRQALSHQQQQPQVHRRASSTSSVPVPPALDASPWSTSSLTGLSQQRQSVGSSHYPSSPVRPLPTPEHTPLQGSFAGTSFDSINPESRNADVKEVEMAMRRAILDQQRQHQQQQQQQQQQTQNQQRPVKEETAFPYSLAPSVSTLNSNSPATPNNSSYPDELNDSSRGIPHDFAHPQMGMPKLNRTISDIYQDELYNPAMAAVPQTQSQHGQQSANKPFHAYQNIFNDRLQAAQQGHMAAQQQNEARESPFRKSSPYAQPATAYHSAHLQQPQLTSDMPQAGMRGMALNGDSEPKTISPKEALLEYHEPTDETSNIPLFPSQPEVPQYNVSAPAMPAGIPTTQTFTGMDQFSPQYNQAQQHQHQYYLQQQAIQQQLQNHQRQQAQQRAQHSQHQTPTSQPRMENSNGLIHHTPQFPPPLPSMESTNSGTSTPVDFSRAKDLTASPIESLRRPEDTSSDAGTYSCTYHGCLQRFETPAKLQKHKREAHRQTTPGSHTLMRDGMMRNSQAGPHKCERINPSTGKPCNSIFSRPYDLTRHEDTIHNAKKQKVRCHLCTEEKTFSRNDALTRHMRVVHPEVNWPGKQKRKGRE